MSTSSSTSGSGGPCGACKFLRRKCVAGCIFAPYFDSGQGVAHFAVVQKVFGASNMSKLLLCIPGYMRLDAFATICYEAQAHLRDTIYECVANIFPLQQQEMKTQRSLEVWKMGIVNYLDALKLQQKLVSDRKLGKIPDTLLSLQHPPTYTLGKRKTYHNLLVPEDDLRSIGAELHYTQRGGDITYHGPHQAILYPIISLRGIGLGARKYVENLELTMIELASLYGVKARVGNKCETGVWVENRKIGAIGVQISSGFTSHGLAFNIDPDMNYFKHIVPCGIADKEVTSLKMETEKILPADEVIHEQLVSCFAGAFGFDTVVQKECTSILLEEEESDKNLP